MTRDNEVEELDKVADSILELLSSVSGGKLQVLILIGVIEQVEKSGVFSEDNLVSRGHGNHPAVGRIKRALRSLREIAHVAREMTRAGGKL
jgi:hypothetical protein